MCPRQGFCEAGDSGYVQEKSCARVTPELVFVALGENGFGETYSCLSDRPLKGACISGHLFAELSGVGEPFYREDEEKATHKNSLPDKAHPRPYNPGRSRAPATLLTGARLTWRIMTD